MCSNRCAVQNKGITLKVNAPVIDEEEGGGMGNKELVHHLQITPLNLRFPAKKAGGQYHFPPKASFNYLIGDVTTLHGLI